MYPLLPAAQVWIGTALACGSALAYAAANTALREVAYRTDFGWAMWASCLKAVPAAAVAWLMIGWQSARGRSALPPRTALGPLLLTGLVMQLGGNVLFQVALGCGGLALTVPIVFAGILVGGAVMGRIMLGEPITPRSAAAMALLGGAVLILGRGAEAASLSVMHEVSTWGVCTAIAAALGSGLGYAFGGVMIRRCVTRHTSVVSTVMVVGTTGVVALGGLSLCLLGPAEIAATSSHDGSVLLAGGVLNALAFFAVSGALQRIPVVRVNLINSSQAALAAITGVLFFQEPSTVWLIAGVGLSIVGLVMIAGHREERLPAPHESPLQTSEFETPAVGNVACAEAAP